MEAKMDEKGKFYLGKKFKKKIEEEKFLYKAEDLTTHAVVFGMTGSGKTGMSVTMLEEAIENDIPIIVIDPKGDVSNLKLIFPELSPEEFKKWVSPVEARKEGKTIDEYAKEVSERWKNGLKEWGIGKDKIKKIKDKSDVRIFTPGSSAGLKISILEGFKKPEEDFEGDEEAQVEKIRNSVSALLSLLDIESDPLKSKPHILISNLIEYYWRNGKSLSIEELIINIQKPPIKKLGVFDINQIIDEKERVELAFNINNIIASPSFRFWTSGMPLSVEKLYEKKNGKIPVNIFYIAHLSENERMFFVSLLLNEIVYWLRKQKGSSDLKYIFYMDEIFGYIPPYPKNPPSKKPLLLLLKQARAFGLGVVLVTQNPKDIDYKGLTNAGSWFIGRLQAEGDKERVAEGLSGIVDRAGESLEISETKEIMSSLKKRVFMIKNVHRQGIDLFHTRWAITYLAGPLTREQIKGFKGSENIGYEKTENLIRDNSKMETKESNTGLLPYLPAVKADIMNYFEETDNPAEYRYVPSFLIKSSVVFDEQKFGLYIRKKRIFELPIENSPDWGKAKEYEEEKEFSQDPDEGIKGFEPFETDVNYKKIRELKTSFKNYLFTNHTIKLFINRELNLISEEGESEESFRLKCKETVEKMIDREVEKAKDSFERKIDRYQDRLDREKIRLDKLEREYSSKKTEEIVSIGETVLGLILGKSSRRALSTAARRRRMTASQGGRIEEQKEKLSQLEEEIKQLKEELEDKIMDIEDKFYDKADSIEPFEVRLEKDDIVISEIAILWKAIK
jgi:hypothetical protein